MGFETKYRIGHHVLFMGLLTLASFLGVSLFYNILQDQMAAAIQFESPAVHAIAAIPRNKNFPLSHYRAIIERNLFKTDRKKARPAAEALVENLEATKLDLTLWGTITGSRADSYAVIEASGAKPGRAKQALYHVGDTVQGATINKILDEKVILTLNGRDEVLAMEEFRSRSKKATRSPVSTRQNRPQNRTIRRSQIENAMQDLGTLMKQIRVSPHRDGIRISRVSPRSLFRRMGIRNGDIITSVDGKRIESVDSALRLYDELLSSSQVSLKLKRRGREQEINYRIQ